MSTTKRVIGQTSALIPDLPGVSTPRRRLLAMSLLAALMGIAGGLAAYGLYAMIRLVSNLMFYHQLSIADLPPSHNQLGLWVIPLPILGAVIVGLMAKYGSKKIRGHGLPEAIEAVLFNQSRVQPRVALLKPTSVAIGIGTGSPFGAEGPIIQTGGALGSILGQALRVTVAERKMLLACGAAAGMAATFSTPLAAVLLAIELLLFEYKARSFIPLVIASTVATAVRFLLLGHGSMFSVGAANFNFPDALPWYVLLGIGSGFVAVIYTKALYKVEDLFEKIPSDPIWWPIIACAVLGVVGYFVPRVLGIGYDSISDFLNPTPQMALRLIALVLVAKAVVVILTLGSGHSGGILAPTFFIGAAAGALFAGVANHWVPSAHLSPNAFALVAMAAVFGAAARAPLTFIVFAFELTRDYDSVLPLMLAVTIAHFIALIFMENSILTEKLARRGLRVHQEYEVDVFQQVMVQQAMDTNPTLLDSSLTVGEIARRLSQQDMALSRHQAFLLTDAKGELAGIVTRGDLLRAYERDRSGQLTLLEAGSANPHVTYPDETLSEALARMLRNDCGRLPVVARDQPKKILGYLGRAAVLEARLRRLQEDHEPQPGWLKSTERTNTP
jgi:H+/Cl- antiporter ClcA/CBS domain-containing protein